jgi:hypothetical protein
VAGKIGKEVLLACVAATIACSSEQAVQPIPNASNLPPAPMPAPIQAAEIIKVSGDDQEGRPGDQLQPIIAAVRDTSGKPVPGVRVRFSVTAGDGLVGFIVVYSGDHKSVVRYLHPADQVTNTNDNGEALALWWLGRHGENTLLATVESEGKPLEVTFRATSVSNGYAGGSFALTSPTSVNVYDGWGGPYDCVVKSGSLVLSPDGSFEGTGNFVDCSNPYPGGASFSFNVIETGFYAVSDSTIVLHYLRSNDTTFFFDPRDVHGVMSEDTIAFTSLGAEWLYTRNE